MTPTIEGLTPFGAQITGLPGTELTEKTAAEHCRRLLNEHGVLVYRDAFPSDEELVALTRHLGIPLAAKTREHRYPEIDTITSHPDRTTPTMAAIRRGNLLWHIDGATGTAPQKATLLAAREIPESGGNTEFVDTTLAYGALPPNRRQRLNGLRVVHSFAAAQRRANPEASENERTLWARVPTREHPLVWPHLDGRISLLIGATAQRIVGLSDTESAELLAELEAWATQPRFVLSHRWRPGDLVIWDNTTMLHRARPYAADAPRLMHRTTIVGEELVAAR